MPLEGIADTGAMYLVIPRQILESLVVEVTEQRAFHHGGRAGDVLRRWRHDAAPGRARISVLTVFGGDRTQALLDAVPLETFGFGVDPIDRQLVQVNGLLISHAS